MKRGSEKPEVHDSTISGESAAEFLWQAESSRVYSHAAMRTKCPWVGLSTVSPRLGTGAPWESILALDNAPYHRGCDIGIRVPEPNSENYSSELSQRYEGKRVTAKDEMEDGRESNKSDDPRIEVLLGDRPLLPGKAPRMGLARRR